MPEITRREKIAKQTLFEIGYEYLRNNFHKLNQVNKIRVSIEMLKIFNKDDSKTKADQIQTVIMNDIILKNGQPLRYNIGRAETTEDTGHPGEVNTDSNGFR